MTQDKSLSFYFFDIDDNILFLTTKLYLWNAETQEEMAVGSGEFAQIQNQLGRAGQWQPWAQRPETFRDFRDRPGISPEQQTFILDLKAAIASKTEWRGPSWPLLVHTAQEQRPIALVTARGHAPDTIVAGLWLLVERGYLPAVPPIIGVYTVTNDEVRAKLGAADPAMTVPSVKKLAIKHAVDSALSTYGASHSHRFGMSDDDPNNVVLAISAMRDCKDRYPDKRFFVINTNYVEFVKLEVFTMLHPVTRVSGTKELLASHQVGPGARSAIRGGNASIYVSDMDRAVHFYTSVLGLRLKVRVGADWAEIDAGNGLVLGLHPARQAETPEPGTAGAINVELAVAGPLETVVSDLAARGVRFQGPIKTYENVRLATLLDPDGNALLLAQVLNAGL